MIKVTCFGSRGSLPSPSTKDFSTIEYGGNTTSYLVEAGPFTFLLDMGSGIRRAGQHLLSTGKGVGKHFIVFISRWHWDHIQGGPFFVPLFIPSNTVHFHGFAPAGHEASIPLSRAVENTLMQQQDAPHFPVSHAALPSGKKYVAHHFQFSETFRYFCDEQGNYVYNADDMIGHAHETLPADVKMDPRRWVKCTTIPLNHPNGCLGLVIEYMGTKVVYCTDNEPLKYLNAQITKHGKDADWLLLDGQYTHAQLSGMTQSFGHGTPNDCVDQAKACNAKRVIVHHHDPGHNDQMVKAMEGEALRYAEEIGYPTSAVEFAREGTVWELE